MREVTTPQSSALFHLVVENIRDFAVFVTDLEGRVVSWNPGVGRVLGYTEEEWVGQHGSIIFTPEDRESGAPEREMETALREGRADDTRWHVRKDGSRFWADGLLMLLRDEAGGLHGFVKVLRDNTAAKLIEDTLRAGEERFRTLAETASDVIVTIDEESRILFINAAAEKVFGHRAEELKGQSLSVLMPEYLRHLHRAGLTRYLETGRRHISWGGVELPGLHKDGREIPVEVSFGEFRQDGHHVFTGIIRDIRERKRAEAEREALLQREKVLRAEAESANRLKDEFLATLSHELRTPLTAVLGWARLLRSGALDEASSARALEAVERNAEAQRQLIEDVLDVSRIVAGKFRLDVRPVKIISAVEAAVDSVRPAAEAKGIRLTVSAAPVAGLVSGDASRLQQVFWNLLTNAVKFTPAGGQVEVRVAADGGEVRVEVSDTGQGIETEFLPHVFDRFRQADQQITRKHGGLGLGLSIVRHLVEAHGGTIRAESAGEGRGATFTITLPLAPEATQTAGEGGEAGPAPADAARCPPRLQGLKVLVVDDEPDTREFLRALLEHCDAQVREASSGAEALKALDEFEPHVLVSDIGMPGMSGFELVRQVRRRLSGSGRHLPALALTGYAAESDRLAAIRAGFQTHLSKPVEPDDLVAAVAGLAGRYIEDEG